MKKLWNRLKFLFSNDFDAYVDARYVDLAVSQLKHLKPPTNPGNNKAAREQRFFDTATLESCIARWCNQTIQDNERELTNDEYGEIYKVILFADERLFEVKQFIDRHLEQKIPSEPMIIEPEATKEVKGIGHTMRTQ